MRFLSLLGKQLYELLSCLKKKIINVNRTKKTTKLCKECESYRSKVCTRDMAGWNASLVTSE